MSRPDSVRSTWRRRALLTAWLLAGVVIVARAAQLQIVQKSEWQDRADRQHRTTAEVPATRGNILDRNGTPVAISQTRVRVNVAPHEVKNADSTIALLSDVLQIAPGAASRAVRSTRKWVVLSGLFAPSAQSRLANVRGVYVERVIRRFLPNGPLGSAVLGVVQEGRGLGGIEQTYDSILRGTPGAEVSRRDAAGNEIAGETVLVEAPVSGGDVTLTIDMDLQEIAHQALLDAIESTNARGGDLVITDPQTGEILALVSLQGTESAALSVINAPYEPGSTLKPIVVTGLLDRGLVNMSDTVDTGNGTWTIVRRTITDVSRRGRITVGEALRFSSNVGIAKAAQAYSPLEQYETLRDFGLGVRTGLPLPGEQPGLLRHPDRWSGQSPVSLAIGYELSVTPLQMALAYGALANGGRLMEPRLIREVRDPRGKVVETQEPRVVRQVASRRVVERVARELVEVVEEGTGTAARLSTFKIAGKSGTARATENGVYKAGDYYASFAGFFPADDPQLVIFVKLDRPRGQYYGGSTAAPVTRATLEAILAAARSPIDTESLIDAQRAATAANVPASPIRRVSTDGAADARTVAGDAGWSGFAEPAPPVAVLRRTGRVRMPDLTGLPARVAVRRLHAYGVRVEWNGGITVTGTLPEAGDWVMAGDTIQLVARGPR